MTTLAKDNAAPPGGPRLRLAAVGDLLLPAGPYGTAPCRDIDEAFADARPALAPSHVLFGNLECTLPGDGRTVASEPRVIATPQYVRAVGEAGFHVVTLANNHMFDCFHEGFAHLRGLLDELGILYFGAGDDLEQASAPAILTAGGVRLAFLGGADERSGTRPFATADHWGVAPLDADRLVGQVRELVGEVDHVLVSPHWGEERFDIPAPDQVELAHRLVDAGASMVLGHHPHVLQGMEVYRGRPIAYSLGNFIACEVPYKDDLIRWNRTERTGCLLTADLTVDAVENVRQTPTYDDGRRVRADVSRFGRRRIAKVNRALEPGVSPRRYRREHFRIKRLRPILNQLRWSKLRRFRLSKIGKAFRLLFGRA